MSPRRWSPGDVSAVIWSTVDPIAILVFGLLCALGRLTSTEASGLILAVLTSRLKPYSPGGPPGASSPASPQRKLPPSGILSVMMLGRSLFEGAWRHRPRFHSPQHARESR
jgi:hypothetical protein